MLKIHVEEVIYADLLVSRRSVALRRPLHLQLFFLFQLGSGQQFLHILNVFLKIQILIPAMK